MLAEKIRRSLPLQLMGALLIVACVTPVRAEVVLQGSSTPLPGPAITVNGNVGQTRGNNLFHSFSVFNILRAGPGVPSQESVTFTPPTGGGTISNVISRVTGGTSAFTGAKSSLIDGPLNSSIPGANFWFINPNGIIFGSNAALPTTGSFHASTADYIKLADGNIFAATPSSSEVLTVHPPSAFGFLNANPAGIQVVNALFQGNATRVMQVPAGRTLSLVGGTIDVGTGNSAQGFLLAPGGRLNLVSVASAGEATFNPTQINGPLNTGPASFGTREINVDNFTRLGNINIRGGATGTGPNPATSLVDAKEIFIRSGNLTVDNSLVLPGIFTEVALANSPANGGRVEVRATGDVTITGNRSILGFDSGIHARAGGPPSTTTPPLTTLRDVPDISVEAGGTLTVSGLNAIVRSERFVQGTSSPVSFGNVTIKADRVVVLGGGEISAINRFSGKGGDLTVNAREIVLDGVNISQVLLTGGFTGLTTQSNFHQAYLGNPTNPASTDARLTNGQAGALTVNADTLTMKRGANITADNFAFGKAGDITINVRDLFLSRDGASTGAISTQSTLAGDAGNITIRAAGVIEINSGQISATTNSSGEGGFVDVAAGKSLSISGANGGIISLTAPPPTVSPTGGPGPLDVFAARLSPIFVARFGAANATPNFAALVAAIERQGVDLPDNAGWLDVLGALNKPPFSITAVADLTPGNGGQISVTTPSLVMNAGTRIDSSTLWDGNAGQIAGNVGSLTLQDGAQIRSQSGNVAATSGQPLVGFGKGGSVNFTVADSILITGSNSAVSTNTFGNGSAGSISLSANKVDIQSGGGVTSESGGTLAGQFFAGTGNAGQIAVSTPTLAMADGGRISVATLGAGSAGSILLNANTLSLAGGSQVVSSTSGSGQGGSVAATAGESIFISGSGSLPSGLFSTASSTGNAGQISVSTPTLTMGDGGTISVATSGAGNAGNVFLNARNFSLTGGAQVVSNTSGAGQGGSVSANATQSASISGQGSGLFSTTSGTGNAGQISVSTPTLTMGESGTISVATSGGGNAGNILLNVGNFAQAGGARVDSSTLGAGRGGDLSVTAANSVSISGPGTGLFSTASGTGAGGNIRIQAGQLVQLSNDGTLSAQSTGAATAIAGDINISTPTFQSQNASVTTGAESADGGNISITTTGSLVHLTDSQITTSVRSGSGTGGNIAIDSQLIVLDNSQVLAQAIGGPGGNINITGDVFLVNSGGRFPTSLTGIVDASSALSAPGTVDIEARFTNVVGTFAQLPSTPLQATELLRASCAARFAGGKASSLVLGGRDGLPLQPGDLLPSPLHVASDTDTPSTGNKVTGQELPTRFSLLGSKDRGLNQYSLLPNAKCSL
jgi:filamentous hemagglutinin family protein